MSPRDVEIELRRVNKWYGRYHALRDVDLEVGRGECVAICGPSGSGKSTLIRCLNGLEAHQSGTIRVAGHQVDGHPRRIQAARWVASTTDLRRPRSSRSFVHCSMISRAASRLIAYSPLRAAIGSDHGSGQRMPNRSKLSP